MPASTAKALAGSVAGLERLSADIHLTNDAEWSGLETLQAATRHYDELARSAEMGAPPVRGGEPSAFEDWWLLQNDDK